MIDHMSFPVKEFETSRRFYDAALKPLGIGVIVEPTPEQTGGYRIVGFGKNGHPQFWLSSDDRPEATDDQRWSGFHIAFVAEDRAAVDAFYAAAMANGGRDNGPPGIREHYHPTYYAAFVLDPDGINVEAVCHKG